MLRGFTQLVQAQPDKSLTTNRTNVLITLAARSKQMRAQLPGLPRRGGRGSPDPCRSPVGERYGR
jgi:hypothetical protein